MALRSSTTLGIIDNTPRARALRHLQDWLGDGRLVVGAELPPEGQLANKFDISRTTIRAVLASLNEQGLIQMVNRKWIVQNNVSPNRSVLSDGIALIAEPTDNPLDYTKIPQTLWHMSFIHMGAAAAIRRAGYDSFYFHPERIKGELIHRVIAQRPKGAIIIWRVLQEESGRYLGKALQEANIPLVIYGDIGLGTNTDAVAGIDSVVSDHEAGAYALTKWLIGQGRKRILRFWQLHMKGPEERESWLFRRDLGYERAMREAGLEPLPALEIYDPTYREFGFTKQDFEMSSRTMAGYLVEYLQGPNPIDAIMTPSDGIIGQLSAALRVHGKKPNEDVLLVGYDNMWDDLKEIRQYEPLGPAATVDKRNLEIGSQLVSLLQQQIDGRIFPTGECKIIKPTLMIRPSAFPDKQAAYQNLLPIPELID